jgi:hypothetical protein
VNQTFVNEYFPGVNPLGQHMEDGAPFKAPGSEIVGVVGDSKFFDVREKPKQRWLESFLFGVRRLDPMALSASVLLIAGIALLAGYLPARRAANIDPMQALRHE